MIHAASQYLSQVDTGSHEWLVFRTYRDLAGFAVPVFVMISGTLFLGRDLSIEVILKKYVLRIAIAFAFWSFLYAVTFVRSEGVLTMVGTFVKGYSHLWFLYMIVGLYIITPILHKVVEDDRTLGLFMGLGLLCYILIPDFLDVVGLVLPKANDYLVPAFNNLGITICTGYVFYYCLGYYLSQDKLSEICCNVIIILGAVIFILQAVLFVSGVKFAGVYAGEILNGFEGSNALKAAGLFLLCKRVDEKKQGEEKGFIKEMGALSFGAYLIHQMVITLANRWFGINTLMMAPEFSVPVIVLMAFVISYSLTWLIRRSGFVRKYLT